MRRDDLKNYRLIALTNIPCKLMEKMEKERLMWRLEHDNLLCEILSGFRKGRLDLLILERVILEGFSKSTHTLVAFFDIKKAYDRVYLQANNNQSDMGLESGWQYAGVHIKFSGEQKF
jgi:hypothetical protein